MKYLIPLFLLLSTGCITQVDYPDGNKKWYFGKPDKPEPYSNTNPMIIKPK